jgi:hypothetical protein
MQASCFIVEADDRTKSCDESRARTSVTPELAKHVRDRLLGTHRCSDADGDCLDYQLCGIEPLQPGTAEYDYCLSGDGSRGNGWCYIAPHQGLGVPCQVDQCPATEQQKIRFAGKANPSKGSVTFFACAGAPQGGTGNE